jgi:hypothetical protein
MRRPEIPIATAAQTTPQTHESAEAQGAGGISGMITDVTGAIIANATVTATALGTNKSIVGRSSSDGEYEISPLAAGQYTLTIESNGFQKYVQHNITVSSGAAATVDASLNVGSAAETITVESKQVSKLKLAGRAFDNLARIRPGAMGFSAGTYRPTDAIQEGDVSTNAFDDFFEYALTQPVTIHKNESAMVPILQQDLPAEHVTLWSEKENTPLRAVWLENKSKLTLDSGSFSIFESGEFAGEGLLDPIHPGERRLLSYAADQAVRVKVTARDSKRNLHHLEIRKGAVVETYMDVASVSYSATNSAELDRVVLLEHARRNNGWQLDDGLKAEETSPNLYRFRLPVPAHSTATLEVRERGPEHIRVTLNSAQDQTGYLLDLVKRVPDAREKLTPVIEAQVKLADLDRRIDLSKKAEETASADEARDRENLTALKGNDAAKRFVDELNRAEDQLQADRKQTADLEGQKQTAVDKLNELISQINLDWDVKAEK